MKEDNSAYIKMANQKIRMEFKVTNEILQLLIKLDLDTPRLIAGEVITSSSGTFNEYNLIYLNQDS